MLDKNIQDLINDEFHRQQTELELIASENYQSKAVLEAQSSVFANKYAEWYPWHRYYWGQTYTDQLETLAIQHATSLFKSDHANVQALSWANANLCFYTAVMDPWDTILGMDLTHGWHLTHWAPITFFSKIFNFQRYKTLPNWQIDFVQLRSLAQEFKPKVILAWFSAYPRELDYAKFAEIAKENWSILYADISHIGGFVASWLLRNPFDYWFHAIMTTTHKSLRWPRWAIILSKWTVSNPLKKPENTLENLPTLIDRAVFPGFQWWPHMNTIAGITIALDEASKPEFHTYAKQALTNAQILASELLSHGYKLITWWTDNHMIIIDFTWTNLDWAKAEKLLEDVWISTSKSTIPDDPNPPFRPSGLRIWTPAITTRWVKENWMKEIASFIHQALSQQNSQSLKKDIMDWCKDYPLP